MGSARRGSNPLGVVCCTILRLWSFILTHPARPQEFIFSMFLGFLPSSDFPDQPFSGQDTLQQASYGPRAWDLGWGGGHSTTCASSTQISRVPIISAPAPRLSERLRGWTRNQLGSARKGSNPLGVVGCTILCLWSFILTQPASPQEFVFSMFLGFLPSSDFPDQPFSGQDTLEQASYGPCAWDLGWGGA